MKRSCRISSRFAGLENRGLIIFLLVLSLSGCAGDISDLREFVEQEKARPPGPIEPLPQIQPYETFTYQAQDVRSPFQPDESSGATTAERGTGSGSGIQPDFNRNREYLEQFPLDTLSMVGTITANNQKFALVADPDGAVHRVQVGNYLGQNHGKIIEINDMQITITEIVPDGLGGWIENQAAIAADAQAGE
ncbi:MAG TPA: pilus assembly protein PilP [Gammaproteobacteria bacterium]